MKVGTDFSMPNQNVPRLRTYGTHNVNVKRKGAGYKDRLSQFTKLECDVARKEQPEVERIPPVCEPVLARWDSSASEQYYLYEIISISILLVWKL